MKKSIITIRREFGSGGGMIGKMVAEQLGIPCYDREMIDSVAKETGFDPAYIEETEQRVTNSFLYNIALGASYGYGVTYTAGVGWHINLKNPWFDNKNYGRRALYEESTT